MRREITLKEALAVWKEEMEAIVWDVALPKAAAAGFKGVASFDSEGGKYRLTLRENLNEPGKGLITVEVKKTYQEELEGRSISLVNRKGDVLLEGEITEGRVAQKVERIRDIDITQLFVKPKGGLE